MRKLGRAPRVFGVPIDRHTAKDIIKAARDLVAKERVSEELAMERLDICSKCPHYNGRRCDICGCFMQTKSKLPSSHCPLGKWPFTPQRGDGTSDQSS